MKNLIFLNLVIILSFFQLQSIQIFHKNGKIAWNGTTARYDNGIVAWNGNYAHYPNGIVAWNGTYAHHINGKTAWDGTYAHYDNGKTAWDGTYAHHDNGKTAWDGTYAHYDNGQIAAKNFGTKTQQVDLMSLELNELEISDKIKLLTKTFNKKVYVVGLKIQLSKENAILINKEDKLTTNIIQLDKDIHLEIRNKKAKLSVLGQNVINQK